MLADDSSASHGVNTYLIVLALTVLPCLPYINSLELSNSSLIALAIDRAVPDGASTFWLWCCSIISTSKLLPRKFAALRHNSIIRFTPSDILLDWNTAMLLLASSILPVALRNIRLLQA